MREPRVAPPFHLVADGGADEIFGECYSSARWLGKAPGQKTSNKS
jgi:hypothetical protein